MSSGILAFLCLTLGQPANDVSYYNYRSHGLPVVGVSSVGRLEDGAWRGHAVIGCSLAMGGDGTVAAQAGYGEAADELVVVTLRLRADPAETRA